MRGPVLATQSASAAAGFWSLWVVLGTIVDQVSVLATACTPSDVEWAWSMSVLEGRMNRCVPSPSLKWCRKGFLFAGSRSQWTGPFSYTGVGWWNSHQLAIRSGQRASFWFFLFCRQSLWSEPKIRWSMSCFPWPLWWTKTRLIRQFLEQWMIFE